MRIGRYLVLLVVLGVAACTTPNLQPIADQTAKLAAAVKQQNADVGSSIRTVADRVGADSTARSTTKAQAKAAADNFAATARVVDEMVDLAAGYTGEIAALGAAGEKGGEAADQLANTIQGFSNFLGFANTAIPLPVDLGGTIAGEAVRETARAFTRVQAQNTLLATMELADDGVRELAKALVEMYGRPLENAQARPMERAVTESARLHRAYLRRDFDVVRIKFYETGRASLEGVYGTAGQKLALADLAAANSTLQEHAELIDKLAELQPKYDQMRSDIAAVNAQRNQRIEAGYAIADAADAWAQEHQRLLGWFRQCAGTRVFEAPCGDFSAQNMQAQIDRIRIFLEGAHRGQ